MRTRSPVEAAPGHAGIADHLRVHAGWYYPQLQDRRVQVRLRGSQPRTASLLLHYDLAAGAERHAVVVKIPLRRPSSSRTAASTRPQLNIPTDASSKHLLEHHAMRAIEQAVQAANDERLSAVRVLDHLVGHRALVLEAVSDPTLVSLTRRRPGATDRRAAARLVRAYRHTGRWFALLHGIAAPGHAQARRTGGAAVTELLAAYADHLRGLGVDSDALRAVARTAERGDGVLFPSRYELGWGHGDAAPRNVFVGERAQVAGFDVLGRWRTPIHEDLAFFLTALRSGRREVLSQGYVRSPVPYAVLERAFLSGYGEERVPPHELHAYQLLLLLDRWASVRSRPPWPQATGGALVYRRLTDRYFDATVSAVLGQLSQDRSASRREAW